jgi:Fe-S cluster assembly protein SufD
MPQSLVKPICSHEELEEFSRSREEPAWLRKSRAEALDLFLQGSPPDRAQHLWRYSDPSEFEPSEAFWNGKHSKTTPTPTPTLTSEAREKGVSLLLLQEAAAHPEHGALVQQHLGALVGSSFGRFEALNGALWQHGVFLYVPKGVELEEELTLDFAESSAGARRVLALIGERAAVTLVERHHDAAPHHVYGVTEIFTGSSSRLKYMLVQTMEPKTIAHLSHRLRLGKDARALSSMLSLGAKTMKLDTGTLLAGEGSEVETIGLLFGSGRQAFDHHTVHHHTAPHTNSNLDFKAVVTGRARSAYTGNITIEKEAPFSSAYQTNNNLLLSDKAQAESIPELEIKVDEVQCSHGATVGQVDPDELFYLMSRGIPEKEAVRQIVRGFLEAILQKVPAKLQDPLRSELDSRLQEI